MQQTRELHASFTDEHCGDADLIAQQDLTLTNTSQSINSWFSCQSIKVLDRLAPQVIYELFKGVKDSVIVWEVVEKSS